MPAHVTGLHHVTAIAAEPRRNLAFYTRVLGLRFVKKSVNQDDPGTYHLYYGNHAAEPGTIMTFFPWIGMRRGRPGTGQACATGFSVPAGSLGFWRERLEKLGVPHAQPAPRFADEVLTLTDPDGLPIELVATAEPDTHAPARADGIPPGHAIRGFHGTTLGLADAAGTAELLTGLMGFRRIARDGHRTRFAAAASGPGAYVDLLTDPALPRGLNGAGTVHHVAFRVPDATAQLAAHAALSDAGLGVSPVVERAYFKSIYYREPGGVLFEIATDPPGFAIDEPLEKLGTILSLPPRLEPHRAEIEAMLPPLD